MSRIKQFFTNIAATVKQHVKVAAVAGALTIGVVAGQPVVPTHAASLPDTAAPIIVSNTIDMPAGAQDVIYASSFIIDMSGLMDQAIAFFNGLFPVLVPILGISLGGGIIALVIVMIRSALKFKGM